MKVMHPNRTNGDSYGKHDPWNTPCNGFTLGDHGFDFTRDPLIKPPGRHQRLHHHRAR